MVSAMASSRFSITELGFGVAILALVILIAETSSFNI
jgi:hypothetical protein